MSRSGASDLNDIMFSAQRHEEMERAESSSLADLMTVI